MVIPFCRLLAPLYIIITRSWSVSGQSANYAWDVCLYVVWVSRELFYWEITFPGICVVEQHSWTCLIFPLFISSPCLHFWSFGVTGVLYHPAYVVLETKSWTSWKRQTFLRRSYIPNPTVVYLVFFSKGSLMLFIWNWFLFQLNRWCLALMTYVPKVSFRGFSL